MNLLPNSYSIAARVPSLADFQHLRQAAGLSPFPESSARAGLAGTYFGAVALYSGEVVGMGRISGDGGLFFQLTDIAVLPSHQGQGLGKAIVHFLLEELSQRIPGRAYVSLIADGLANRLYAKFGFEPVAPKSQGMAMWLEPSNG